jgi:hypothetical protein
MRGRWLSATIGRRAFPGAESALLGTRFWASPGKVIVQLEMLTPVRTEDIVESLPQVKCAEPPLKFGVGLFQPDKEKNDATYRPLANYLSAKLNRPVELRTVDSWEGLAKSLANGETDLA